MKQKVTVPPLILESDKKWEIIHAWMVKNGIDQVLRDGGLHSNPKDVQSYQTLQNCLHWTDLRYHIYEIEKSDLRKVWGDFPRLSNLHAQSIFLVRD